MIKISGIKKIETGEKLNLKANNIKEYKNDNINDIAKIQNDVEIVNFPTNSETNANQNNFLASIFATRAVIRSKISSGFLNVIEHIGDGVLLTSGKVVEGGYIVESQIVGLFSDAARDRVLDTRVDFSNAVKDMISTNWVGNLEENSLKNNPFTKNQNDLSYIKYNSSSASAIEDVSQFGTEMSIATGARALFGGAGSFIAGFLSGVGEQAEKVYQNNRNTTGAQEVGIIVSGLGEGAKWYALGNLGQSTIDFVNNVNGFFTTPRFSEDVRLLATRRLRTLNQYIRNTFVKSLTDPRDMMDMFGVVCDNVADWANGNEEFNLRTGASAVGELAVNIGLNSFFNFFGYGLDSFRPVFDNSRSGRITTISKYLVELVDGAEDGGMTEGILSNLNG